MKPFESEAYFLTFNSKYHAKLIKAKIKDGTVLIDDGTPKLFYVDETKPMYLTVKGFLKKTTLPLYIIKWNSVRPYDVDKTEEELTTQKFRPTIQRFKRKTDPRFAVSIDAENVEQHLPEFKEYEDDKTPEYVAKLVDLKIMSNLMGRQNKFGFLFVAIALLIGVLIGYFMYKSGVFGG